MSVLFTPLDSPFGGFVVGFRSLGVCFGEIHTRTEKEMWKTEFSRIAVLHNTRSRTSTMTQSEKDTHAQQDGQTWSATAEKEGRALATPGPPHRSAPRSALAGTVTVSVLYCKAQAATEPARQSHDGFCVWQDTTNKNNKVWNGEGRSRGKHTQAQQEVGKHTQLQQEFSTSRE